MSEELVWLARTLDIVRERTGLDFSRYRASTMLRRVRNRMIAAGAQTLPEYHEQLQADPGEAGALLERLTIKVSRFYRDAATFRALGGALERWTRTRPPRLWSAGCGQGEEPYSLAILAEASGLGEARVLATDIDPSALAFAREARYPEAAVQEVPAPLLARAFDEEASPRGRRLRVKPELRARVDFHIHDLLCGDEPPRERGFDLVCCRNVLIYLQRDFQERVQWLLARSLAPGGLLCLGEAEWLLPPVAARFEVIDRKARLFRYRAEGAEVRHV